MAYGSWAGIYTSIKLQLMAERNRVLYFVLECLAIHADQFGFCYPGNQRLGEMAGYGETTIDKAILDLVSRQWIKVYETSVPYRRGRIERDIQISPQIIYIRDELTDYAWSIWNGTSRNFETETEMLINYVQPESESRVSVHPTTILNYPSSVSTTTTKPVPLKKAQPAPDYANQDTVPTALETQDPPEHGSQRATLNQRGAQNNQRGADTPNNPPPQFRSTPPQNGDLAVYHVPLPETAGENLAQRLRSEFGTRIAQARQLVAAHGIDMVIVGIDYVYQERKNARIKNAFGLLKWWLINHAIAPGDCPPDTEAHDYSPGQYDQFLQS